MRTRKTCSREDLRATVIEMVTDELDNTMTRCDELRNAQVVTDTEGAKLLEERAQRLPGNLRQTLKRIATSLVVQREYEGFHITLDVKASGYHNPDDMSCEITLSKTY